MSLRRACASKALGAWRRCGQPLCTSPGRSPAPGVRLSVTRGDIADLPRHQGVLVNPSNELLEGSFTRGQEWHHRGRHNVDTAMHRAAGPALLQECLSIPRDENGLRCPVGQARATGAGGLRADHVIHCVGPFFNPDSGAPTDPHAEAMLREMYVAVLRLAAGLGASSIAFPALACGVRGFPHEVGARVGLGATAAALAELGGGGGGLREVEFVLLLEEERRVWARAARELGLLGADDRTDVA